MQLSQIVFFLTLASTAYTVAVDSSAPADSIVARDTPVLQPGNEGRLPNPNHGYGVVDAGDLLASRGFARDGSRTAGKRDLEIMARNAEVQNKLFKRTCWYGEQHGCSNGWCYSKCGGPGEWCWLAANRGNGARLKCSANGQCNPRSSGAGCRGKCSC